MQIHNKPAEFAFPKEFSCPRFFGQNDHCLPEKWKIIGELFKPDRCTIEVSGMYTKWMMNMHDNILSAEYDAYAVHRYLLKCD